MLWVLGGIAFVGCLGVTWWGLFGDRARGRRRCPRCWYDLSHSPGMQCAECGHTAASERHLFRTRRRVLPALAAALIASLGASWALERAQQRGWVTMLPTRVIVMSLPLVGGAYGELTTELTTRIGRSKLSNGQLQDVVDRCIAGDRLARPVSPSWEGKYGVLLDYCRSNAPKELNLDPALARLPARVEITSRRVWPEDAPLCLDLDVRDWWPAGTECRVLLTPEWAGGQPVTVWRDAAPSVPRGFGNPSGRTRPYPLVIDPPPTSPAVFEVVLERLVPAGEDPAWEPVQRERISVEFELDGFLSETVHPNVDEQLDAAVRSTFSQGVVKWTSGRSPVRVRFDPRSTYRLGAQDTAIGASVDVLHDGVLARRLEIWWPTEPVRDGEVGWVVAFEDEDLITSANAEDGRWQLRVRGDPVLALRAGAVESYWAGDFIVPLEIDRRDTVAPPKYWWRDQIEQMPIAAPTPGGSDDGRPDTADG